MQWAHKESSMPVIKWKARICCSLFLFLFDIQMRAFVLHSMEIGQTGEVYFLNECSRAPHARTMRDHADHLERTIVAHADDNVSDVCV